MSEEESWSEGYDVGYSDARDQFEDISDDIDNLLIALVSMMRWIGPPPTDKYSFDSQREDAWNLAIETIREIKNDPTWTITKEKTK